MTKETAHRELLDRDEAIRIAKEYFHETDALLQEIVNYGTNLLVRSASSGGSGLTNSIVIGVFAKHAIVMADSIQINLSQGAVLAAHIPLRALFETFLYLSWLLEKDTDSRARHYHVWNLREQRRWAARTVKGTPENAAFASVESKFPIRNDKERWNELKKEAKRQIVDLDAILANPANSSINSAYESMRNKKRDYDVEWYAPTGAATVFQIAKLLGYEAEYKMFYSTFSGVVHASDSSKHLLVDGANAAMASIRSFESVQTVYSYTFSMMLRVYLAVVKRYRPEEKVNFSKKYEQEWRHRILTIKSITYNTVMKPR